MPVQLNMIDGLMLEKKVMPPENGYVCTASCGCGPEGGCGCCIDDYNEAIDDQGIRKIGLNHERLTKIIKEAREVWYVLASCPEGPHQMEDDYITNALIAAESEIIEVK